MPNSEYGGNSGAKDQERFREEHALVSTNALNLPLEHDLSSMLNFLRRATPAELRAHNLLVMDAHERAKQLRIQWQKDHRAGLLPLKEQK